MMKKIVKIKNILIIDNEIFPHETFNNSYYTQSFFVCHNNPFLKGSESPNLLGYKYSWLFYEIKTPVNNNYYTDYVEIYNIKQECKENIIISLSLNIFCLKENISLDRFYLYKGKFKQYNHIAIQNNNIVISNNLKSVEIKIGRFLQELKQINNDPFFENNLNIEDISHKFKQYLKQDFTKLEFLKNNDILKGYSSSNYYTGKLSLNNSCMTDKHELLNLYTNNQNIELATLLYEDKIIARTIIWNINNTKYHDTIYHNEEWALFSLQLLLNNIGIFKLNPETQYVFNLNDLPILYPYLDNMKYLNPKLKQLTNIKTLPDFNMLLNTTSGSCYKLT